MTKLLPLWVADYRLFSRHGAQCGLGLGVLLPASAITSVLATPPVVSHIFAVAGRARSSGTSGPPPLAVLAFLGSTLQSVTLPVWSSQSKQLLAQQTTIISNGISPNTKTHKHPDNLHCYYLFHPPSQSTTY